MKSTMAEFRAEGDGFPMRLNKFLAHAGASSRREADGLIEGGKVLVNGRKAVLGDKVNEGDTVAVQMKAPSDNVLLVAYWKPKGADSGEERTLDGKRVAELDLLEKSAEGLVLYSSDRRLSSRVAAAEQEFYVKTQERTSEGFADRLLRAGDSLVRAETAGDNSFSVSSRGGIGAVRRACEELRHTVVSVKRTRIGTVGLKGLAPGSWKKLSARDVERFLASLS